MNIFVLDTDQATAASYHLDKHVTKMCVEYAQILSSAVRISGIYAGYKLTHVNHPCCKWARQSLSNWHWLKQLAYHLNEQYKSRYKPVDHKSWTVAEALPEPKIPDIGLTPFALAMPTQFHCSDAICAYRNYLAGAKKDFATWHNGEPTWWQQHRQYVVANGLEIENDKNDGI